MCLYFSIISNAFLCLKVMHQFGYLSQNYSQDICTKPFIHNVILLLQILKLNLIPSIYSDHVIFNMIEFSSE